MAWARLVASYRQPGGDRRGWVVCGACLRRFLGATPFWRSAGFHLRTVGDDEAAEDGRGKPVGGGGW